MFVEQLSKEELLTYLIEYEYNDKNIGMKLLNVNNMKYFHSKDGIVSFYLKTTTHQFSDFDYKNNYRLRTYEGLHNKNWLNFMYEKFGTPYYIWHFLNIVSMKKNKYSRKLLNASTMTR